MFQTFHPAHTRLETGGSCLFIEPFSARGSSAETEASQQLVVAVYVLLSIAPVRLEIKQDFAHADPCK
jgi:hypothetical protein